MHGSAQITPDLLLRAYAAGIFPMAERRDAPGLFWVSPEKRGIIPLDRFHIPKRLARTVRSNHFEVRTDQPQVSPGWYSGLKISRFVRNENRSPLA